VHGDAWRAVLVRLLAFSIAARSTAFGDRRVANLLAKPDRLPL